ncbi:hypothetical protein FIBSPDRAFT_71772 [Athelia psychrophila]|uniref:Uncharacterized protein n=1 Tax=Athelia psychrophila TaxID=1759441 RepID=A0A166TXS4_9AGAM|nr:hypothetical protein FIBSPDRAFT_71772 [Fibularhizoctonia sp. CBS 109695]
MGETPGEMKAFISGTGWARTTPAGRSDAIKPNPYRGDTPPTIFSFVLKAPYILLITVWLLAGLAPPINSTKSTGSARQPSFACRASSLPRCYPIQVTCHLEVQTWHVSDVQRVSSAVVDRGPGAEEQEEGCFYDES